MTKVKNKKRVLVVEDEEANILIATMCLNELGYPHDIAKNSKQALQKFEDNKYGIILMDIGLAGRDGIETTQLIRSIEMKNKSKFVPIVALTAAGDKERCLEAGMDDYLLKPITLEVLKDKLEHIIE